jgi:hypothetical protein
MDFGGNGPTPLSAAVLFTFPNARMMCRDVFSTPKPLVWLIGVPTAIIPSILGDIIDMGIFAPSTLIFNPWTKYEYNSDIVMEQLDENN